MCGIAGFSLTERDLDIVNPRSLTSRLALGIEERGRDATGIAWDGEDSIRYHKAAVRATDYVLDYSNIIKEVPRTTATMLIHTRMATQGSPKQNTNNHPIVVNPYGDHDGLVGVHNGCVWGDDTFWRNHPDATEHRQGQVDSEALFHVIARFGPDAVDRHLDGDASVAWLPSSTGDMNQLHLARYGGRPLDYVVTKNGSLIFASTMSNLEKALRYFAQIEVKHHGSLREGEQWIVMNGEIVDIRADLPVISLARSYGRTGGWSGWTGSDTSIGKPKVPTPPKKSPGFTESEKARAQHSLSGAQDRAGRLADEADSLDDFSDMELALYHYYFGSWAATEPRAIARGLEFIYSFADDTQLEEHIEQIEVKLRLLAERADELVEEDAEQLFPARDISFDDPDALELEWMHGY